SDPLSMVPRLGDDARRLEQNAEKAEPGIHLHGEVGLDAEALRAVAMPLLDATLGVTAVAAHVPFAASASWARHRIGPAHDPDDVIAARKPASLRRLLDDAQRFVAQHEALFAGRREAVGAGEDFAVGAANAERKRAHEHRAVARRRLGHLFEAHGTGMAGCDD